MRCYLRSGMTQLSEAVPCGGRPTLELYTFEDAEKELSDLPFYSVLSRNLGSEKLQYCRAELLPDCVIGTLVIPDKASPLHGRIRMAYYLERKRLIFLDQDGETAEFLNRLLRSEMLDSRDPSHFFFSFLIFYYIYL